MPLFSGKHNQGFFALYKMLVFQMLITGTLVKNWVLI